MDRHGKVIALVQANILPSQWDMEVVSALSLMIAGLLTVLVLDRMAGR